MYHRKQWQIRDFLLVGGANPIQGVPMSDTENKCKNERIGSHCGGGGLGLSGEGPQIHHW